MRLHPMLKSQTEFAKCGYPKLLSPVDGSPMTYCETQRKFDLVGMCGSSGRFWAEKVPESAQPVARRPWWKFWG
jgi:hypothetical protein